jgi:hypothetical protein
MEFMNPLAFALMAEPARNLARSAMPNAPVIPAPVRRTRAPRTRRTVAVSLHRLADRLQPT